MLKETIEQLLPRLIASGVDYNDARMALSRINTLTDWCPEWVRLGEAHEALGESALAAGRAVTTGDAFRRAAICYHFGQSVFFADPEVKFQIQQRQQAAYRKALPYLRPPGEQLLVAFQGISFPGNLRLPIGTRPAPCVLLNPGGDSTKEEFSTLEDEFLKRGLATFSYDGPGQSTTRRQMKLRHDFEKPVTAVVDMLSRRPEIDANRLGIWGRSFGGYAAPRAASFEHRLKACISIGGFYDMGEIWDRFPATVKQTVQFAFGATNATEARRCASACSLKGVLANMLCPFLIVHSGMDVVCPVEDSRRMEREAGGPTTLEVFPDGNHVCDNIPFKARPLMADWMADRLGAAHQ
jgi:2,6-dihydroxypseudooxynicotine hydrolase